MAMRILALDIGDRYIGIAATDHIDFFAYRYGTIDRKTQHAFLVLANIVKKEQIQTIIFGIPYHVEDGSETEQTRKTRAFAASLQDALGSSVKYEEQDETLTSHEAKRNLQDAGSSMSEEHAEAARILLSEYIASYEKR